MEKNPPSLLQLCRQLSRNCSSHQPSNHYLTSSCEAAKCAFALGTLLVCYANKYGDLGKVAACPEYSDFVLPEGTIVSGQGVRYFILALMKNCEIEDPFRTAAMICIALESAIANVYWKTDHVIILTLNTCHRILCAAFIIAHKLQTDMRSSMRHYAIATLLTGDRMDDVNGALEATELESMFLRACNFGMPLVDDSIAVYCDLLRGISTQFQP